MMGAGRSSRMTRHEGLVDGEVSDLGRLTRRMWYLTRKYSFVTVRPDRRPEYAGYIRTALDAGYCTVPYETWALAPDQMPGRTLVLRHDIDTDAASALEISDLERDLGVQSTFYARWSTLDCQVVRRIRDNGSQIGLHYETLTRYAFEHGLKTPEAITDEVLSKCRAVLRDEIAIFRGKAGACASVTAHGDARRHLLGCDNSVLLLDQDPYAFGVEVNGDRSELRASMASYVTDGEGYPTYWCSPLSLPEALSARTEVIVFNSHPHHWLRGARAMGVRSVDQVGFLLKHPFTWERGKPEALAWQRHRVPSDNA